MTTRGGVLWSDEGSWWSVKGEKVVVVVVKAGIEVFCLSYLLAIIPLIEGFPQLYPFLLVEFAPQVGRLNI